MPIENALFKTDYLACDGERYVWKCKNDPDGKLCNENLPNSENGELYWYLVDGFPLPETDYEEVWVEPSHDQLVAMGNRIPT